MNTVRKIVIVLCMLGLVIGFFIFDAHTIAPKKIVVRNETLSSDLIGEQMDDINILFFSDLEYGTFVDSQRLNAVIERINSLSADIVIFGGDLYDAEAWANDESDAVLIDMLGSIKAPLGKFAVYGDNDHRSDDMKQHVDKVLTAADFEILNNRSVTLHNGGSQSITLVGLDNGLNGMFDATAAYEHVSVNSYTIAVCHTPDSADFIPEDLTDYYLSGHSHGGQIYWFAGASYTPPMATAYLRGKHSHDTFTIDITTGVGTTEKDVRFLCDPEVVVYRLHSTKENEPQPEKEETPVTEPEPQPQPAEEEVPQEPDYTEPIYEEPVYEEPVYEEPAYEEPQEEDYSGYEDPEIEDYGYEDDPYSEEEYPQEEETYE